MLDALLANQQLFTGLTWADGDQLARKTEDFIEELYGYRVPPNFFRLLSVSPLLGRTFAEDEATPVGTDGIPTKDSVIVISHGWRQGWQPKAGQKFLGSGIGVTTLKLVQARVTNGLYHAIGNNINSTETIV